MKNDFLLFLLLCLPVQVYANGSVRWETLPLTGSYTSVTSTTDFGYSVACHGVKGNETIALTGEKSVCLAKSDTAEIIITADDAPTDCIRFYWEQEFSANVDAVITINDTLAFNVKSDNQPDNSQLFEHLFSPQVALHKIQIRQSSASSGQITIGNIQIGSTPALLPSTYRYGALVISEMMIDPEPQVYLPNGEYVELTNTGDSALDLSAFSLAVNGKSINLPSYTVPGRSCVVLNGGCYGDTANFRTVSLPSLSNEGFDIAIYTANQLIYSTQYEADKYSADVKSTGGWSLEKLSVATYRNDDYIYSQDEHGGSPGSVTFASVADCPQVIIKNIYAIDSQNIAITLSSQMDSASFSSINIKTDNQIAESIVWDAPLYQSLTAHFAGKFMPRQKYELTVDQMASRCGTSIDDARVYWSLTEKPSSGDVLFNEIMFDPQTGSSEYIELKNVSSKAINLTELQFATYNEDSTLQALYPLSLQPKILFPDSIIVLSKDFNAYTEQYNCSCSDHFVIMNSFPSLVNEGATMGLFNRSLIKIDEVAYSPDMHSRDLVYTKGVSLERTSVGWSSSPARCGYGSPGCRNTEVTDSLAQPDNVLCANYFSPNNDGEDDVLSISFAGEPNSTADVNVFAESGSLTVQLAKKTLIAGSSQFVWDGYADDENAPAGIYVVMVTLYDSAGNRKVLKKPTVLLR